MNDKGFMFYSHDGHLVKRLAEADKDVAGFVNKGGMVVESPSTGHKIFSSRFNSKERLDWYANYKPFGT